MFYLISSWFVFEENNNVVKTPREVLKIEIKTEFTKTILITYQ